MMEAIAALIAQATDDRVKYHLTRALNALCDTVEEETKPVKQKRTYVFTDPDGVEQTYTASYSDKLRWVELYKYYEPSPAEMEDALELRRRDYRFWVRNEAGVAQDAELHRLKILEAACKDPGWHVIRESKAKKAFVTGHSGYDASCACFTKRAVAPLKLVS